MNINKTGNYSKRNWLFLIEKNIKNNQHRQDLCQHFFETEEVDSIYFAKSAVLGLYAVGRTSGLVLENSESAIELV